MKLLFLTGSRGEWGYIRPIIKEAASRKVNTAICATNMLLLNEHGSLIDEIKNDGYNICDEISMALGGDCYYSMAKSLGVLLTGFIETLKRERPDWLILAGDRGEQLMGAIAASYTYTPVAHIQAGERSGNIDGVARHAIGKLVHLHFAANHDAAQRLKNLGEEEFRIHNVGAPQIDELVEFTLLTKSQLNLALRLSLAQDYLLVVFHGVTEDGGDNEHNARSLVDAINDFGMQSIWIMPNNDTGSAMVRSYITDKRTSSIHTYQNLSRLTYLSLLKGCKAIVGNSSSGLLEAPTFSTPCVNIGRRQQSRIRGKNVIDCEPITSHILESIKLATSDDFRNSLQGISNPYGDGLSSHRILDVILDTAINDSLLTKKLTF